MGPVLRRKCWKHQEYLFFDHSGLSFLSSELTICRRINQVCWNYRIRCGEVEELHDHYYVAVSQAVQVRLRLDSSQKAHGGLGGTRV